MRASTVLYNHRDRQGSVVATTYTGGNIGVKYRYTPYGLLDKLQVVNPAGGSDSTFGSDSELGYTGGLRLGWNPATGARQGDLLLLGARVYDAALKRWLQPDTVDVLRYTYTGGDPVNLVDPTGREPVAPVPTSAGWFSGATGAGVGFNAFDGSPKADEPDPCRSDPDACRFPGEDIWVWGPRPPKSPEQVGAEADHRDFMFSTASVRADNVRMAALGAEADSRYARFKRAVYDKRHELAVAASFVAVGYEVLHYTLHVLEIAGPAALANPYFAAAAGAAVLLGVGFIVAGSAYAIVSVANEMNREVRPRRRVRWPRARRRGQQRRVCVGPGRAVDSP